MLITPNAEAPVAGRIFEAASNVARDQGPDESIRSPAIVRTSDGGTVRRSAGVSERLESDKPEQLELRPLPEKSEAKIRILSLGHEAVTAFCNQLGVTPPTEREWRHLQELLTYINSQRFDDPGGRPRDLTLEQIGKGAWVARYGITKKPRTVESHLKTLRELELLTSIHVGGGRSEHSINFRQIRTILNAFHTVADGLPIDRKHSADRPQELRTVGARIAPDRQSIGRADYMPPAPIQAAPSTAREDSSWAAAAAEVFACGVRAAQTAIDIARGATRDRRRPDLVPAAQPEDIRALVTFWRLHRDAWTDPSAELFQRILIAQPELPPHEGWSPMLESHETRLDRERRVSERKAALERQQSQRRERAAAREQAKCEWEQGGRDEFMRMLGELQPAIAKFVDHQPRPP